MKSVACQVAAPVAPRSTIVDAPSVCSRSRIQPRESVPVPFAGTGAPFTVSALVVRAADVLVAEVRLARDDDDVGEPLLQPPPRVRGRDRRLRRRAAVRRQRLERRPRRIDPRDGEDPARREQPPRLRDERSGTFLHPPAGLVDPDGKIRMDDLGFIVSLTGGQMVHMYADPREGKLFPGIGEGVPMR